MIGFLLFTFVLICYSWSELFDRVISFCLGCYHNHRGNLPDVREHRETDGDAAVTLDELWKIYKKAAKSSRADGGLLIDEERAGIDAVIRALRDDIAKAFSEGYESCNLRHNREHQRFISAYEYADFAINDILREQDGKASDQNG